MKAPTSVSMTALRSARTTKQARRAKFTGQIAKVTIELKPGKPLDKAEADRLEENQELEQQSKD